jgi:uncharacterized protein (TIGR03437 family)
MLRHFAILAVIAPLSALAQSTCPAVNFLEARTANLKPSVTSHIDVVRQSDGSYTGFEVTDAAPYRPLAVTPHFEAQFAACLPHTIPSSPATVVPAANPSGGASQTLVSMPLANGNTFVAHLGDGPDTVTIYFDIFDAQHDLLSEKTFSALDMPPGYYSAANDVFLSLALADLNLDGKPDLIATFNTPVSGNVSYGGVWTFLGNGNGTFQAGVSQILTGASLGSSSRTLAIGDANGDGKPDIVLGGDSPFPYTVALGNGDGTFGATPRQSTSVACQTAFPVIADLNGDGKADLVLACTNPGTVSIAVLLGNGNGTFQAATYYAVTAANGLAVGDLNGDGIPDIASSGGTILFGDGTGGFPTRQRYVSNASGSVMIVDFDGDGKPDIVYGAGNPTYVSGSVADPTMTVLFGDGKGAFVGAPILNTSRNAGQSEVFASADFNGDGVPDIVLASSSLPFATVQVTTFLGQGDAQFTSGAAQTVALADGVVACVTADFNHDGKPDFAVLLYGGEVLIYLGNGDGSFRPPLTVALPPSSDGYYFLHATDVNGDGIPDLVVNTYGATTDTDDIYVLLGDGDGTFSAPVFRANATSPVITLGDFNGDGKLDLAVATPGSTTLSVYLGKGDGTFPNIVATTLPGPFLGSGTSLPTKDIVASHFNGGSNLDLALTLGDTGPYSIPQLAIMFGNGKGGFTAGPLSPGTFSSMLAADTNGDSMFGLVYYDQRGGPLSVQLNNGDGTFQSPTTVSNQTYDAAIAYIAQDGLPNVAALTSNLGGIAIFQNLSQPVAGLTVVSGASFLGGALAPDAFASAFGVMMGSGVTLSVQDSAGVSRTATLLYASPDQLNFLVPAGTALGTATVTVTGTQSGKTLNAQVPIAALAPALFTVGAGIAAADVVQVAPDGTQTYSTVFAVQSGRVTTVPIDLSQPGQVFLELYGTGFDSANAGSTVVEIQGVSVPVTYSGSQSTFPGLDQINVQLPVALAGTGVASVSVSIGGHTSNTVYVTIQ